MGAGIPAATSGRTVCEAKIRLDACVPKYHNSGRRDRTYHGVDWLNSGDEAPERTSYVGASRGGPAPPATRNNPTQLFETWRRREGLSRVQCTSIESVHGSLIPPVNMETCTTSLCSGHRYLALPLRIILSCELFLSGFPATLYGVLCPLWRVGGTCTNSSCLPYLHTGLLSLIEVASAIH